MAKGMRKTMGTRKMSAHTGAKMKGSGMPSARRPSGGPTRTKAKGR